VSIGCSNRLLRTGNGKRLRSCKGELGRGGWGPAEEPNGKREPKYYLKLLAGGGKKEMPVHDLAESESTAKTKREGKEDRAANSAKRIE